jgi:hypothetical protein
MKLFNSKYILLVLGSFGLLSSCRDDSKIIYDYSKFEIGAYARMLLVASDASVDPDVTYSPIASVTVASFEAAKFNFFPEITGAPVSNIRSFDISVRLLDTNGNEKKAKTALGSVTSFTVEPTTQLPRGLGTFTGKDIETKLGITIAGIAPGDQLEFTTILNLKDGRKFSAANVDPNMNNPFYATVYYHLTVLK